MGQIIDPGSSRPNFDRPSRGRQPFFVIRLVRTYGSRGVVALLWAALAAFAPLGLLVWANAWRLMSVVVTQCGQSVVVKPGRFQRETEDDKPGETALLQVTCEVPTIDGWRELLSDEDPVRRTVNVFDSCYVRNERVYLRNASDLNLPFGLLGRPPVSVWLPAGNYQIMVVHEAPRAEARIDATSKSFPLISVFTECAIEAYKKTVCRIRLSHYDWGGGAPIMLAAGDGTTQDRQPTEAVLGSLLDVAQSLTAVPTPGGFLLAVEEPEVRHTEDHRLCTVDFADLHAVPREWTRDQIATLRNWLPNDAALARSRLSSLVSSLEWREFFEGWFCYAAAGIAGLVFTKWGAVLLLEPHRRRESFAVSLKLLLSIFFLSMVAWFLFNLVTESLVGRDPLSF
jgi:hypothetical protein